MRLIDADQAKEKVREMFFVDLCNVVPAVIKVLDSQPTIETKPDLHAQWSKKMVSYEDDYGNLHFGFQCSNCKAILNKTKYCGNCSAKMDGKE